MLRLFPVMFEVSVVESPLSKTSLILLYRSPVAVASERTVSDESLQVTRATTSLR